MQMQIKDSFWIVGKIMIDNEKEAIEVLKEDIKGNKHSILQMFTFKPEGDIELKQVGWEQIAKRVIKNEG